MPTPRHRPTEATRAKISALVAFGIREGDIARHLGISEPTLRKYYRDQLDLGAIEANAKIAATIFNLALSGNVTAAIFWAKARMGWFDRPPEVVQAPAPVPDMSAFTAADRAEMRAIIERSQGRSRAIVSPLKKANAEVLR